MVGRAFAGPGVCRLPPITERQTKQAAVLEARSAGNLRPPLRRYMGLLGGRKQRMLADLENDLVSFSGSAAELKKRLRFFRGAKPRAIASAGFPAGRSPVGDRPGAGAPRPAAGCQGGLAPLVAGVPATRVERAARGRAGRGPLGPSNPTTL